MTQHFELAWRGGATEARLHRCRPAAAQLPWGTIDLARYGDAVLADARATWSHGVFTEYASAAAFSTLATALLECGAPVDLTAACADIVVDELAHVELASRLTMELGGAVPLAFDLATIAPLTTPGARPLARAAELAVTTSVVGEALSVPAIARARALAKDPLVHAILELLLADEGPHARLGFWFLEWAADQLTADERAHLAALALDTLEVYAPLWQDAEGGHDPAGRRALRAAVVRGIARPLARHGVALDATRLAALLREQPGQDRTDPRR